MNFLDIGEVSARTGLAPSTLRFYEEKGIIASVARRGLRRQFEPQVLQRLALVGMARSAGFSLEEIVAMFGSDGRPDVPRDELHLRADGLESKARGMMALASMMRHVADCQAPSHLECPTFRKLLRVGVKHEARKRRHRTPRGAF